MRTVNNRLGTTVDAYRHTDGIHGVRRELEDTIKDKGTTLEEDIAPVPAVVLDDIVRLGLDPKVKGNQCNSADPPKKGSLMSRSHGAGQSSRSTS